MREPESWRDLLKIINDDASERERICRELGIRAITLTRWVNGDTDPRPQNLYHLLSVLPQHREHLIDLLQLDETFQDFSFDKLDEAAHEIPVDFYLKLLKSRATMLDSVRYRTIGRQILQQALNQLDPEKLGMSVSVVRCMPPSLKDQKIHSLRENIGVGNPPWGGDREQNAMLLGAESICGYVVGSGQYQVNPNVDDEQSLIPAHRTPFEKSAAVYPIILAGRIAGALLISSTQYNYFVSQARLDLMQSFANLIALIFEPEEFYDMAVIQLDTMPDQEVQKPHFARFLSRVTRLIIESRQTDRPLSNTEADNMIWRQLEDEMLQLVSNTQASVR